MGSSTAAVPAAAAASGSATARWAVGERRTSASLRDAALARVSAAEAHPLARTSGAKEAETVNRGSAATGARSTQEGAQGLVVLADGDLDPLGVLSVGLPAEKERERARTVTTGAVDELATVRERWKAHTDRVMATFAEHTFKIKAVGWRPRPVWAVVLTSCAINARACSRPAT